MTDRIVPDHAGDAAREIEERVAEVTGPKGEPLYGCTPHGLYDLPTLEVSVGSLERVLVENRRLREREREFIRESTRLQDEARDARASEKRIRGTLEYPFDLVSSDQMPLERSLADLEESCVANYMGGYHQPRDLEIFRHGMKTVANSVGHAIRQWKERRS